MVIQYSCVVLPSHLPASRADATVSPALCQRRPVCMNPGSQQAQGFRGRRNAAAHRVAGPAGAECVRGMMSLLINGDAGHLRCT